MHRPISSRLIPTSSSRDSTKNHHGRQKNKPSLRERRIRSIETLEQRQCFATMLPLSESFVQSQCDVPDSHQSGSSPAEIRVMVSEQSTGELGLSRQSVAISTSRTHIEVNTTGQLASFDVEVITEAFEMDVSYLAEESPSLPDGESKDEMVCDPSESPARIDAADSTVSTSVDVATDTSMISIEHSYQESAQVAQTPICECDAISTQLRASVTQMDAGEFQTPRIGTTVEFEHVKAQSAIDGSGAESVSLDVRVEGDNSLTTEIEVAYEDVSAGATSNVHVETATEGDDSLVQVDIEHGEEMPSTACIPSSRPATATSRTSVNEPVDSEDPSACLSDASQLCCCNANAPVTRADTYSVSVSIRDEDSGTELEMSLLTVNRGAPNVLLSTSIREDAIHCGSLA